MPAWGKKINMSLSCYHCPSKASDLDAAVLTVENTYWLPLHYLGRWYITALAKLLLAGAVTGKSVDILQNSSNKDFGRRMTLWLTWLCYYKQTEFSYQINWVRILSIVYLLKTSISKIIYQKYFWVASTAIYSCLLCRILQISGIMHPELVSFF